MEQLQDLMEQKPLSTKFCFIEHQVHSKEGNHAWSWKPSWLPWDSELKDLRKSSTITTTLYQHNGQVLNTLYSQISVAVTPHQWSLLLLAKGHHCRKPLLDSTQISMNHEEHVPSRYIYIIALASVSQGTLKKMEQNDCKIQNTSRLLWVVSSINGCLNKTRTMATSSQMWNGSRKSMIFS